MTEHVTTEELTSLVKDLMRAWDDEDGLYAHPGNVAHARLTEILSTGKRLVLIDAPCGCPRSTNGFCFNCVAGRDFDVSPDLPPLPFRPPYAFLNLPKEGRHRAPETDTSPINYFRDRGFSDPSWAKDDDS